MAKTVSCRDVGMDCDFVARGNSEEEILSQCADHARVEHNMNEIPADVRDKLLAAVRDEAA
jgi:predicted small metal-binding protein